MDYYQAIEAIIARLVDDPRFPYPPAAELPQPWRAIYTRITRAKTFEDALSQLREATKGLDNGQAIVDELRHRLPPDDAFCRFPSLLDMQRVLPFPPTDWLWPSWIPIGHVTLLAGSPGSGKSMFALDLARRVIGGLPFPDGAAPFRRGNRVLMIDAEGTPDVLNQRARAWGMDLDNLFLMVPSDPGQPIDLIRPEEQERLEDMCFYIKPDFAIIDSLAAASSRSETSLEAARELLGFLAPFAARYKLSLLIIHHLRKARRTSQRASPPPTADDLRGTSHISAVARAILTLSLADTAAARPDPNGPRRLEVVKTNLSEYPPPLFLRFESGPDGVPNIHYIDALEPADPPTKGERCARWLVDYLEAHGPARPRDVIAAAAEAGFSGATVYRARRALGSAMADQGQGRRDPRRRWWLVPGRAEGR